VKICIRENYVFLSLPVFMPVVYELNPDKALPQKGRRYAAGVEYSNMSQMMSRHDKDHVRPRSRRGALAIAVCILAAMALGILGIGLVGNHLENRNVQPVFGSIENRFEPTKSMEVDGKKYAYYEQDFTNILLIGVDRDTLDDTNASIRGNGQADFLLLLSMDRNKETIVPLHIDRDSITPVQVYGIFGNPASIRELQVCLSYAMGTDPTTACENTVKAVSDMLDGIRIDGYLAMDMSAMTGLNEALGGVTVTLNEDFSHIDPEMTLGKTMKLEGAQAEIYLRSRMTVGDGTNAGRMERQRAYMSAALELMKQRLRTDQDYLSELAEKMEAHIFTDMEEGWAESLAISKAQYTWEAVQTLPGEHRIGENGFIEFHLDRNALIEQILNLFYHVI